MESAAGADVQHADAARALLPGDETSADRCARRPQAARLGCARVRHTFSAAQACGAVIGENPSSNAGDAAGPPASAEIQLTVAVPVDRSTFFTSRNPDKNLDSVKFGRSKP